MSEGNDTLNLSPSPNLGVKVGDDYTGEGPSTMDIGDAQAQIERQAKLGSMRTVPGQVARRNLEQRPMAQFTGNYEQPPVGNGYQHTQAQPIRPDAVQQQQMQQRQQMQQMQQIQQPVYQQPQMQYQQPMYQQQPMQYQQSIPQVQMNNTYGAAFSEIIGTSNNEYECWIDLPGIDTSKLSVLVKGNTLHVSGERKLHSELMGGKKGKRGGAKAMETQSSVPAYLLNKFTFTFPFYKPVDEENIKAEYINGQLHVVLTILSSLRGVKVDVKF